MGATNPSSAVRRQHLEGVRDHQPVALFPTDGSGPNLKQASKLLAEGILEEAGKEPGRALALTMLRLSANGSQMLREAEADIGRDAVAHLKEMYPAALEAVPGSAAVSLRNFINSRVTALLKGREGVAQ